jgi:hypothetical protein
MQHPRGPWRYEDVSELVLLGKCADHIADFFRTVVDMIAHTSAVAAHDPPPPVTVDNCTTEEIRTIFRARSGLAGVAHGE